MTTILPIISSINQTWQTTLPPIDNHTHKPSSEGGIFSGNGVFPTGLSRFLVQAIIIIALSRFLHIFLRKLRQPRVIAEVISGIMLGPSMLGRIPGFKQTFFPDDSSGILGLVANIGLVFYLFLVGLELEPQVFFNNIRTSAIISLAGIILPFLVGVACSYGLYTYLLVPNVNNVPFMSFMLFTGVAISITAFPVLARILTEKKLLATPVGTTAISAAAIDDAVAWTLLALVISILHAKDQLTALYVFLVASAYAAV
uniref:Cation/H+ exchanger domain-containing protein n=1 Tax=Romanomermis culicivorax TaxID=13658 RepID=A0A915KGT4_ROMCU